MSATRGDGTGAATARVDWDPVGREGSHSAVVISTLDGKQDRLAVSPSAG